MSGSRKVLVVDDDPDIRYVAELALGTVGDFEVVTVGSGAEALARCKSADFDVVLLDVMMPGLDGPATLARLRADHSTLPVVFLTATGGSEALRRLDGLPVQGRIDKPFDPMTLAEQLSLILDAS